MNEKALTMKGTIYKTSDGRIKEDKQSSAKKTFKETYMITACANKHQQQKSKEAAHTKNALTINRNICSRDPNPQSPSWHLSTFSSPEQLAQFKESQERLAHENMLKGELYQFRHEVEQKYQLSETNRKFIFPRTSAEFQDSESIDRKEADCKFI
jgi:hypothetical protein